MSVHESNSGVVWLQSDGECVGHQNCDRRQALAPSRQGSHVLFDSRTTRVSLDVLLSAMTYSDLDIHHSAPWAMINMLTVSRIRVACEHLALLDRPTTLVEIATWNAAGHHI